MITLIRVDERLIHGQVAYAWTTQYHSDAILVVTEFPKNELERMSLEMACPRGMKAFIETVDRAVEVLKKYERKKFFVVTDSVKVVRDLILAGVELNQVNIGGLYHKEEREQISKTVYVDESMKKLFKEIYEQGIQLEIRATPSDSSQDLMKLI